ncbi:hypothetical protein BO443_130150 [Burkholderia orbicola]
MAQRAQADVTARCALKLVAPGK